MTMYTAHAAHGSHGHDHEKKEAPPWLVLVIVACFLLLIGWTWRR